MQDEFLVTPLARKTVWFCVLLGVITRLCFLPGLAARDVDEDGYIQSGLPFAEGLAPTFKAAPAAPQVWLTWSCVMVSSGWKLLHPAAVERALPGALKPYGALNAALFDCYRDFAFLRIAHLILVIGFGLLGVWAAATLGATYGDAAGAMLLGGAVAAGQLFVSFSLMTRPYICAWSLALCAVVLMIQARSFVRILWAFAVLGLSIGTRVEMLTVVPLALWIARLWFGEKRLRNGAALLAGCAAAALLAAPWYIQSLITNLKSIVAVRAVGVVQAPGLGESLREFCLEGGLGFVALAAVVAIYAAFRELRWTAAVALSIVTGVPLLMALHGSGYGLHHDGGALVSLLFLGGLGLKSLPSRFNPALKAVAVLSTLVAVLFTSMTRDWRAAVYTSAPVSAWLEANVKPGSRVVFEVLPVIKPLPTQSCSDALWQECATSAWKQKYDVLARSFAFTRSDDLPRALSIDNMTKELQEYRSWFILGSRSTLPIPRFDVQPLIGGALTHNPDPIADYLAHDGVYVVSSISPPSERLGQPSAKWGTAWGVPTYIFAKPSALLEP